MGAGWEFFIELLSIEEMKRGHNLEYGNVLFKDNVCKMQNTYE